MTRAFHREVPATDRRTNRRLAFGVFAAPVAWFVHEIVGVSVLGRHCQAGGDGVGFSGEPPLWVWAVLVVLPTAAALTALAGVVVAYRVFRRTEPETKITRVEGWSRVEFIAVFGAFFSGFLLLNIIYFGVMPFVVQPCMRVI